MMMNNSGLNASDYEHPTDREALAALKKIPLLNVFTSKFIDFTVKSGIYTQIASDCFRVTDKTLPQFYDVYKKAALRLNISYPLPRLYLKQDYDYNAFAAGIDEPFIVINSYFADDASEDEIAFIMGHELGHINSGHTLYHNLAAYICFAVTQLTGSPLLSSGLILALSDWMRKSELTADRAGLIACKGIENALSCQIISMGCSPKNQYVKPSYEEMAEQYLDFCDIRGSTAGSLIYLKEAVLNAGHTHPFMIERIKELTKWAESSEYLNLVSKINY